MANSTVCQSKWKPIVESQRAKPKIYRQAPTHWLKFYEEAVIEARTVKVYQICTNVYPRLTFDFFTARSNYRPYAFIWSSIESSVLKIYLRPMLETYNV